MIKKKIVFKIRGNQENPVGNPIPYFRSTQGSQFSKGAKRYNAWKDYVRANYLDATRPNKPIKREDFGDFHDILQRKPIGGIVMGRVTAEIYFGGEGHADPDNIVKGILDALFANDKHIDVETKHSCRNKNPHVVVTIQLE